MRLTIIVAFIPRYEVDMTTQYAEIKYILSTHIMWWCDFVLVL